MNEKEKERTELKARVTPATLSRLETTGLTVSEIHQLVDLRKLSEYLSPVISRVGDPTGPVSDRDISGHVHTTG